MTDMEGKPEKFSWLTNKIFLTVFGVTFALVFVVLVVLMNLATQIEDLEDKFKYKPPLSIGPGIASTSIVAGQTVYVPVYSHIYSQGGRPFFLETTLSIRNADPDTNISITSVRYYDTGGKLIKNHLEKPLQLKPFATVEYLVEQRQVEGGSGANFVVEWVADTRANQPVIEAVMVGLDDQFSISFVRPGIVIQNR